MFEKLKSRSIFSVILISAIMPPSFSIAAKGPHLKKQSSAEMEKLGEMIFNDPSLSKPGGQACVSCHIPMGAFTDISNSVSSIGADRKSFGNRNTPTIMYMKYSPPLELEVDDEDKTKMSYEGGLFWDGRANTLEEQAKGPFLNPAEMASTKEYVAHGVCSSLSYGQLFRNIFGSSICNDAITFGIPKPLFFVKQVDKIFDSVAKAIASFERTDQFSPFSSKYDKVEAKMEQFSDSERRGFELFKNEKTANCVACHVLEHEKAGPLPLFTDFSYDNLGVPASPEIRVRGHITPDIGLAGTTKRAEDKGKFKVPSLRNIARTAPYMHNGYFSSLKQVVDFYNTRDTKAVCPGAYTAEEATKSNCWPSPEISENLNKKEMGDLKLSEQDVLDLVAFMETLNDEYWTPAQGWKQPVSEKK